MLWLFIALQVMTPFIHAHMGVVQFKHAGFMHALQGLHSDAAYHVIAADEHGTEVEAEQGMPWQTSTLVAAAEIPLAVTLTLPHVEITERPGAGLPAPPQLYLALPEHTLPHALAPPLA